MKKTARLEVMEDVRLKRTVDAIAARMGITPTAFLRMTIRNGARFYAKKFDIPYLLALDVSSGIVASALEKTLNGNAIEVNDNELKKLEDGIKKLK